MEKITYRIPTQDQYAFVEVVKEYDRPSLSPEEIRLDYDWLKSAFSSGEGMKDKEFSAAVDEVLDTGKLENGAERWAQMSRLQQFAISSITKSIRRNK